MRFDRAAFANVPVKVPYRPKGIFYSEAFAFLDSCGIADVDLIVESGVKNGMSTALISAGWSGPLISIDRDARVHPPDTFPRHTFIRGDAHEVVPVLLVRHQGARVGLLIDGPKGKNAMRLKDSAWQNPDVRVVAIHDLPLDTPCSRHSHEQNFRLAAGNALDSFVDPYYLLKYPNGSGLAIWEK